MAKFGEIVYMVLDLLKERSDDAYYTEEHILFLASKIRTVLLTRRYKGSRNSSYISIPQENKQKICVDLEPVDMLPDSCSGMFLKSTVKLPDYMSIFGPSAYAIGDVLFTPITFIPIERMPYVGYNTWLSKITYVARSSDGYLYLRSNNPQFIFLENICVEAVFSDAVEVALLNAGSDSCADILELEFPLDATLIPSCIELIVQELTGARFAPEDKRNNAKDDFGDANITKQRAPSPVEDSSYIPRETDGEEASQ